MKFIAALVASLTTVALNAADVKPLEFESGCNALVYLAQPQEWPLKTLPDAPAEVVRLSDLPVVAAGANEQAGGNFLVRSRADLLNNAITNYAISFDGYFFSSEEGKYGLALTTDDPVTVWIEGHEIPKLKSDTQVDFGSRGPVNFTLTDSVILGAMRWYRVTILCQQRRQESSHARELANPERGGACFRLMVTTPSGQTNPMNLYLPKAP